MVDEGWLADSSLLVDPEESEDDGDGGRQMRFSDSVLVK